MKQKYRLTDETIKHNGVTLYRIEALRDFGFVTAGNKGGFVQSELNLSQEGDCWIYGEARVYGEAEVCDEAVVYGEARVYGEAMVCGKSRVSGAARVYGKARVGGKAKVSGEAEVCGAARVKSTQDYIVFKNWWSSGRYFTWTRSNNMWKVGCFYGTGEELIHKAYADSEESGKEYERVMRYVASILASK